ncbi:hypothetical protein TEA_023335 [Camellia sinensis var. sinensis]|uniref:tripeptidyl-peptidase II n=1 Tax=Camellia sinensis var. sinensis TaxID=542762 RepID=A0A4S4DYW6_CAMSN|nr:hypothetical protein TEA_023335 [Camellia sinensis var. sinensis]
MPTSPLLLLKGACWARQSFPTPFLSPALILDPQKLLPSSSSSSNNRERNFGEKKCSRVRAMPCSSSDDNGALCNFKLNESTFLASLMPKKEIKADLFIEAHPDFDGRGVVIAIFDSGVDPAAAGLQVTSDGKPKILDVIDCTGSGDIDTSNVVKADADGCLCGASDEEEEEEGGGEKRELCSGATYHGRRESDIIYASDAVICLGPAPNPDNQVGASLVVNSSWKNPSGEWHVGYKLLYELFTDTLTSRLKKERKKKWDEKHQEAIAEAVKCLDEFDKKHVKVEDANLKRAREDLQNKVDFLRKQADSYDDKGPVIDAVVWHDGELWRVALDTQSLEDDLERGKLAEFVPLTNYSVLGFGQIYGLLRLEFEVLGCGLWVEGLGNRVERKFGVFSSLDACSFVANVYDKGNILSIVTDCSPHGTHVAGIASAFHPKEPLLNGVAPGAQLISCKIGDARLGSMETGTGLTRALIAAVEHKCDLINMSYGEPTLLPDYGRFVDLVDEVVNKHRLIFVSSAGNSGPALSTVGAPGGTTSSIIGVGAYVSPAMAAGAHCVVEPPSEGLEYTWYGNFIMKAIFEFSDQSSRGPTVDGDLGVCISAPGGAVAPVPTWTLQRRMLMNGTSMASPSACGGVALLVSAMKAEGIPVSPYIVREALENSSIPVGVLPEDKLTTGQGLMQVDKLDLLILAFLVPFEECIELHSSGKEFVKAPEYLLLTHNGRSFKIGGPCHEAAIHLHVPVFENIGLDDSLGIVVDPTNLSDGLHYYELCGIDCKAPWRGPVFRIPVTITKAMAVKNQPALLSFSGMTFLPDTAYKHVLMCCHIERKYIKVPIGASWVEATLRTSGFDTARRFFVDTVQISPLQRPMKWESVITFSCPSAKSFAFPVEGGRTMELVIAQFWSSGIGSHEATVVEFEEEGGPTTMGFLARFLRQIQQWRWGRRNVGGDGQDTCHIHKGKQLGCQRIRDGGGIEASKDLELNEMFSENAEEVRREEEDFAGLNKSQGQSPNDLQTSSGLGKFSAHGFAKGLELEVGPRLEMSPFVIIEEGDQHNCLLLRQEGQSSQTKAFNHRENGLDHDISRVRVSSCSPDTLDGGGRRLMGGARPTEALSDRQKISEEVGGEAATLNDDVIGRDQLVDDVEKGKYNTHEIGFHGININKEEVVLDGSDAPARIDAEALLSSEKLAPAAILSKIRIPYRPIDAKLCTLPTDRDKLPSGKQILALTLTYKFKLEDGAEVKPQIPLLNNRIYDNKFESQFYMISDSNKRVYTMGDVYPNSTKLPKGEYNLQLYLRHDNVQYLEKMKPLVLFIERNLEDKEIIRLSFYSQPDGPVMGNGSFKSSVLVPGVKEAFYVGPPTKDKLPKNSPEGSVLLGAISYGKLSFGIQEEGKNPQKNPVSYQISYQVPPNKLDEDKGKGCNTACTKSVSERLEEEVRDAKIRVLASLKQGTAEECLEWKKLSSSLKSEYPKYTPLLAKILEGLLSQNNVEDKIPHLEEIIDAADEVIGSVDTDELAKYFSFKSDPEDEGAEKVKKKMETARDQLAEALYQKGLAMAEIESLKGEEASALASTEGANVLDRTNDKSIPESNALPDLFEENFKELKKWVDVKSSKYATLLVIHERRCGRLGTALKALNDMIQADGEAPKKKLYELKLSLLDQIGWGHLVSYERQWMHVRFPANLKLWMQQMMAVMRRERKSSMVNGGRADEEQRWHR